MKQKVMFQSFGRGLNMAPTTKVIDFSGGSLVSDEAILECLAQVLDNNEDPVQELQYYITTDRIKREPKRTQLRGDDQNIVFTIIE